MATAPDHTAILGRIEALAREAAARADTPPSLRSVFDEITSLAQDQGADTPEQSDIPHTENQSL